MLAKNLLTRVESLHLLWFIECVDASIQPARARKERHCCDIRVNDFQLLQEPIIVTLDTDLNGANRAEEQTVENSRRHPESKTVKQFPSAKFKN